MAIGPKITIGAPRVTIGQKDQDFLQGAALTGGNPLGGIAGQEYGEKISKWSTNSWNSITGKNTREAQQRAALEAEKARRESIIKEFGAKTQADGMAFATAMRGSSGGSNKAPGVVGDGMGEGSIAANISSSGTF